MYFHDHVQSVIIKKKWIAELVDDLLKVYIM